PGRLLDHMGAGHAVLSGTEIFVLDEADQMLDLGFLKPIKKIASSLATRRQTLFFSATMPKEIASLAKSFLRDPVKVAVTPAATTVEKIAQRVIFVEPQKKVALLGEVLSVDGVFRALVFTRTKRGADRVAKHLTAMDFRVAAIHGNKSQNQREKALDAFKKSKIQVLVATDIAARGIDVDDVTHVVNFDLPEVPEAYVHRIGRTARAGASGRAISLCAGDEKHLLRSIERITRQKIDSEDRRNDDSLAQASDGQRARGARGGRAPDRSRAPTNTRRPKRQSGPRKTRTRKDASESALTQAGRFDPLKAEEQPSDRRRNSKRPAKRARTKTTGQATTSRSGTETGPNLVNALMASVQEDAAREKNGNTPRRKRRKADTPGKSASKKTGANRTGRKKTRSRQPRPLTTA
ncbi:MAG: helicase-related protein, partial [Hyphomicrobiaceae bacterium]